MVFSLLFGTTWIVNAFVFFAILSSVLLAIPISTRWRPIRLWPLYLILFGLLAANYAVPISALLDVGPSGLRYLLGAGFVFVPVFVANQIFADSFAETTTAPTAFAWNLIGIMLGGLCEYGALLVGYRDLLIVIGVLYLAALISRVVVLRSRGRVSGPAWRAPRPGIGAARPSRDSIRSQILFFRPLRLYGMVPAIETASLDR